MALLVYHRHPTSGNLAPCPLVGKDCTQAIHLGFDTETSEILDMDAPVAEEEEVAHA